MNIGFNGGDLGVRLADINGDGFQDVVQARKTGAGLWKYNHYRNTGAGWQYDGRFSPPHVKSFGQSIIPLNTGSVSFEDRRNVVFHRDGETDQGTRFVDLNGDGRDDLIVARWTGGKEKVRSTAYLNTPRGWVEAHSYRSPMALGSISASHGVNGDLGVRFVDVDGDGIPEMLKRRFLSGSKTQNVLFKLTGAVWR